MLRNGDFRKIAVKVSGPGVRNATEYKKAWLQVYEGGLYLLSHVQSIHDAGLTSVPMHGMRCITLLSAASLWDSLDQIQGDSEEIHGCTVRIYQEAEIIASVHGRATARPVAEAPACSGNPYILSKYTQNIYTGFAGYHSSHHVEMNTPTSGYNGYRIGIELETEFATASSREHFTTIPRNWFFCESDGSLYNAGCEIITIPLIPNDAKNRNTWKPICDKLKELGATSWDNGRCGLHVHIGREILGNTPEEREATLSRLLLFYNLYLNDDQTSTKVFGRARCYNEKRHESTQEFAAVKCLGTSVLKDKEIAKRVGDAVKASNNGMRYYTINTTNRNTIEFRKGRGSLSVDRIQTIVTFCEAVCLYVRAHEDFAELSLEGFREFIRANVPVTNSLYHYYDVVERDC